MSKSNIVTRTLDLNKPPVVTEAQRVRLAALAALTDEQIDTSDAPFRPDAVWVKAVDFPHGKKQVSLRIDEDVLNFFRQTGKRYQTRMNAVLRTYFEAHKTQTK